MNIEYQKFEDGLWNVLVLKLLNKTLLFDFSRYDRLVSPARHHSTHVGTSSVDVVKKSGCYAELMSLMASSAEKHYFWLTPSFHIGLLFLSELFLDRPAVTFLLSKINHATLRVLTKNETQLKATLVSYGECVLGDVELAGESYQNLVSGIINDLVPAIKALTISQRYQFLPHSYVTLQPSGFSIASNIVEVSVCSSKLTIMSEFDTSTMTITNQLNTALLSSASQVILLKNSDLSNCIRPAVCKTGRPGLSVSEQFLIQFVEELETALRTAHCLVALTNELQALELLYFFFIKSPQGKVVWVSERAAHDLGFTVKNFEFFNPQLINQIFTFEPSYFLKFESQLKAKQLLTFKSVFEFAQYLKANPYEFVNYRRLVLAGFNQAEEVRELLQACDLRFGEKSVNPDPGSLDERTGQVIVNESIRAEDRKLLTQLYSQLALRLKVGQTVRCGATTLELFASQPHGPAKELSDRGAFTLAIDNVLMDEQPEEGRLYLLDPTTFKADPLPFDSTSAFRQKTIKNLAQWTESFKNWLAEAEFIVLEEASGLLVVLDRSNLTKSSLQFHDGCIAISSKSDAQFARLVALIDSCP